MSGLKNRIYILNNKDFCGNVNEPESDEALFNGQNYYWLINNLKKLQTASVHSNQCGSGDGGCINPLQCTVVAQQMESEGIVSVSNFLMFIQILGYFGITCTAQYSK